MIMGQPVATAQSVPAPLRVAFPEPAAPVLHRAAQGAAATQAAATAGKGTTPLLIVMTVALLKRTHVIADVERALTPAACIAAVVAVAATLLVVQRKKRGRVLVRTASILRATDVASAQRDA